MAATYGNAFMVQMHEAEKSGAGCEHLNVPNAAATGGGGAG
jgi:hypothetical protein